MTVCVLDVSAALSWVLPDERSPDVAGLLPRVRESGAAVPALWVYEVASALSTALRRSRISEAERTQAVRILGALPITVEAVDQSRTWSSGIELALKHDLSVYDATYLDLALRIAKPLATLDRKLAQAARACGLAVLGDGAAQNMK